MKHPIRLALAVVAASSILGSGAAMAQETVTKPTCKRPEYPGKGGTEVQKRTFNKDIEVYAECIKKYVAEQQRLADDHIKAANSAASEYNTTVKQIQAEIDAAK
ncbi:MAG: hypothetical protein ABI920_12835 [Casimicrobiaceae bacterium]